jgi:hypothetical protein
MAIFQIEVLDEDVPRIFDAFTAPRGWTSESGTSQSDFTKAQVIKYIQEAVTTHEFQKAQEAMMLSLKPAPEIS